MNIDETTVVAKPRRRRRWLLYMGVTLLVLLLWQVTAWLTPVPAPLASAAAVTDRVYEAVYDEDIAKRAAALPKEVNIVVVGLDNRIASNDNHADAIHLITIRTKDSVGATISSIPRGTEVDGYGITEDLSFMANVRAPGCDGVAHLPGSFDRAFEFGAHSRVPVSVCGPVACAQTGGKAGRAT